MTDNDRQCNGQKRLKRQTIVDKALHRKLTLCSTNKALHRKLTLHSTNKALHRKLTLHSTNKALHRKLTLHSTNKALHRKLTLHSTNKALHRKLTLHSTNLTKTGCKLTYFDCEQLLLPLVAASCYLCLQSRDKSGKTKGKNCDFDYRRTYFWPTDTDDGDIKSFKVMTAT